MIRLAGLMAGVAMLVAHPASAGTPVPETVRMSIDESPVVPLLAKALGFLDAEGIVIEQVSIESFAPNDFEMQKPMREGKFDAAYHWYHHTVFGARHGLPIVAVMNFNDAPGMTVSVEASKVGTIRSAADFRGAAVASGAGYGTKSLITHALASRSGLGAGEYRSVITATAGREEKIVAGLRDKSVDVVTSEEPLTAVLKRSGLVVPLYDLTTRTATVQALGSSWPAQSLLLSPTFLAARPRTAQHLVNAFVRTMRWINGHDAEAIAARLPETYFTGKDRTQVVAAIRAELPSFARRDYRISPAGARTVIAAIDGYGFDASASGAWRAGKTAARIAPSVTYDNRLVEQAMARIR